MKQSKSIYHRVVVGLALVSALVGTLNASELSDISINGRSLNTEEVQRLEAQLGTRIKPGDYFIDIIGPAPAKQPLANATDKGKTDNTANAHSSDKRLLAHY